jgi:uncharacterized membrane protein
MDDVLVTLPVVTALACVAALAGWLIAGNVLYLVGTIGLTIGYHVPRNNALAVVRPASREAGDHWAGYLPSWTAGNHLPAAAGLAAGAAFIVALRVG